METRAGGERVLSRNKLFVVPANKRKMGSGWNVEPMEHPDPEARREFLEVH